MQIYTGIDPYTGDRSVDKLETDSQGNRHMNALDPAEAIMLAPLADQLYVGYSLVNVEDFIWNVRDIFQLSA